MLLHSCCNESIAIDALPDLYKLHFSPNEFLLCRYGCFLIRDENKHYCVSLVDTMEIILIQAKHSYKDESAIYVYYSNHKAR